MPIQSNCTSCGKPFRVPDEVAGRLVRCPYCGTVQKLGGPPAAAPVQPSRPASVPRAERPAQQPSPKAASKPAAPLRSAPARPTDRTAKPAKAAVAARKRPPYVLIGGGCALVLVLFTCLGGVGLWTLGFFGRSQLPSDNQQSLTPKNTETAEPTKTATSEPTKEKNTPPRNPLQAVAALLHDKTFAVIRVDLRRLDVEAGLTRFSDFSKAMSERELAESKQEWGGLVKLLTDTGGREVFALFSEQDMPPEPLLVLPLPPGADTSKLTERTLHVPKVDKIGDLLVAGSPEVIARARQQQPTPVPDLNQAMAATEDRTVRVAAVLTPNLRALVEKSMPQVPPPFGDGPSKPLLEGTRWLGLSADLTPKMSLQIVLQTTSPDIAKTLDDMAGKTANVFAQAAQKDPQAAIVEALLRLVRPKLSGDRLTVAIDDKQITDAMAPLMAKAQSQAGEVQSINNLKQLVLALQNYHDTYNALPAQAIAKDGRPLLSWRVQLLPYLEQGELYNQFHLDEPWDSPHNKKLIEKMPPIYRNPLSKAAPGLTTYVAPVGKNTVFAAGEKVTMASVRDGISNTIALIEAADDRAVIWTKPEDLEVDLKQPYQGVAGRDRGWFLAAFVDGSVRKLPRNLSPATLSALFTRNGGEAVKLP